MAKKKPATDGERDHMSAVAALGCIISGQPAEVHHIAGHGVRASHYETIPLSAWHHRNGPIGEAVHSGRRSFEARYGTERELLAKTNRRLGIEGVENTPPKQLPRRNVVN